MFRFILHVVVIIIGISCLSVNADEFPECLNKEIGAFVPVQEDCSKAIFCNGIDSSIVECDEQNPYFSALEKTCSNDITVCEERFLIEKQTTVSVNPTTPHVIVATTTPNAVTDRKPTKATYSTIRPTLATIPSTPIVHATQTTTTTTEAISTLIPSTVNISCPLADDPSRPLYLPHPQSCSQYYLCYHGMPIIMQCPYLLLFDVVKQSCNSAELVNCQISSVSTPPRQCLPHMVMVYPHPKNCNYYYRCEFGYLKVMQCPFGMGWDYEMAICTRITKTKCYQPVDVFV